MTWLVYLRPYRLQTALILIALSLELAFYVSLPLSFRFIIDHAIIPRNGRVLTLILGALAGLFVLAALAGVGKDFLLARVVARVLNDVRLAMFDHLQRLSMAFYSRASTGDLVARFSTDLGTLEIALAKSLPTLVYACLQVVISVVVLLWLNTRLALITLAALPVCVLGPRLLAARATDAAYRRRLEEAAVLSAVQENIGAHAVVRAFGLQESRRARLRERLDRLAGVAARASYLGALIGKTSEVGVNLLQLLIIGFGAWLVFGGRLELGALFAFVGIFVNLGLAISNLSQTVPPLLQAAAGMRRIDELLAEPIGVRDAPDAVPAPRLAKEIRLDRVSFSYGGAPRHLEDVSLSIPAGHSVALVGGSGSGKSTILSLLTRFYDPQAGSVTIDGRDLRGVTQHSLLAQVSIVSQETVLFDTTIRENIRLARPDATDGEIEAAARAAEIHDFILTLPRGYETPVGERGGNLSGGQRQRLALARAVLREPAMLILDEATSALDPATEAAIQRTLEGLARARTVVSVTHRLATAVDADSIVVLDRGRVVERGTHDELLAKGGVYHRLRQHQSGFVISEDGQRAAVEARRLGAIPVFARLVESHLAAIAARFVTERYPPGKRLIEEGDPGDKLYILVRGSVEVLARDRGGEERRVAVLQDGDVFGEVALLENVPRTATIVTLTPCLMLTLGRQPFEHILAAEPELRIAFERMAAARRREGAA
ncbi:MAG: ABC transporter transmembrane domain-containing protein [Candidatus Rokuibacteriota bacterium]